MKFLENEFLIPVFIGCDGENNRVIREIYRKTGIRAHIFSENFSFFQRLFYRCHTVRPWREDFLKESLLAFARDIDEHYCLVIVLCDEKSRTFIDRYSREIECSFVVVDKNEILQ